jgi:peptidoglycan/xylan/chitin deacetylase (PgdA/CDA1 family)
MSRACFAMLLLTACKPPVPIVNYHSVGTARDEFAISRQQLEAQLDALRGRRTISLHQLAEGDFRPDDVVLTFDDGTSDALTAVLPILQSRGMRGTFFIVTDFVGQPGYLDWEGVRKLRDAGMEIGSHTVDHVRLGDSSEAEVRRELRESKRILEQQLHQPVEAIAYPYNSSRPWIAVQAREAGYRIGVSGPAHGGADPLDLARISVRPAMTLDDFQRGLRDRR